MESVTTSIIIGVISGILTSFVIFVSIKLFKQVLSPWYENRLYKSVVLSDSWEGTVMSKIGKDSDGKALPKLEIKMEIVQNGYDVGGYFSAESFRYNASGKKAGSYSNFYNLKGSIKNNFLTLEYSPVSNKRTGMGLFLFEVCNGGNELIGDCIFLVEGKMAISHLEKVTLIRMK